MNTVTSSSDTMWVVSPYSWEIASKLARELGVPFAVATVLAGRGLTDVHEARAFIDCSVPIPDPFLFADMGRVVGAITEAIEDGRRIVIHGDYDADGVTATALMVLGLRELGVEAEWYLPSRFVEGFGLSRSAVESIAGAGPALLITVDCGINYPDEVAFARSLGLEVVVIDHHHPGPVLPECPLIHPTIGHYPSEDLCGVGLAFKVLQALHSRFRRTAQAIVDESLHRFLDLVAVGTIADLAPLRGENRYYVREGLKLIGIGARPGFRALTRVAGCAGAVDCGSVAFRLAPRLNAAGRLADATPPLRLLLTDDEAEATAIADRLHELNVERQDVERRILEEAVVQVDEMGTLPPILVVSGAGWHEGVVGIVASRLVERYNRPAILLGVRDGVAKGSGRSIGSYDLVSGLNTCADHLTVFGGHKQAVGLTLDAGNINGFKEAIERHAGSNISSADLRPTYRADAILRGEDINADTAMALASLGPFGSGNPRPRFLLVNAHARQVEKTLTGSHLRCVVEADGVKVRAIGFNMAEVAESLRQDSEGLMLGVQIRINEWQGVLRPEFLLEKIGRADGGLYPEPACGNGCVHRDWHTVGEIGSRDACAPAPTRSNRASAGGSGDGATRGLSLPSEWDLRGERGRVAAVAQVLATGEPVAIITCSIPHLYSEALNKLPLRTLVKGNLDCVGKGCWQTGAARIEPRGVAVIDWEAAIREPLLIERRAHVVVADPPYRPGHVSLLREVAAAGVRVHLCYGAEQRRATASLLRLLVHPRFAMVCLYRALGRGSEAGDVHRAAAELAWEKAQIVLTHEDLAQANEVLAELDVERAAQGGYKMEAAHIPIYAAAEADYEECSRLCQIL